MLYDEQLLHKNGVRVRGVKVVGRHEINPLLRREVKAVLTGPFTLHPCLKQILTLSVTGQPERVEILPDIRIKHV